MFEFILASIVIELTPGPNMTWLAVLGATRGRMAALSAVAGICLGLGFAGLIAGVGLAFIFETYPTLLTLLRWAGTLYLFYLAYDAWQDSGKSEKLEAKSNAAYFTQGLISNALNPKAYLFYAAILPQFLIPTGNAPQQIAILTAVYVAIATIIHASIALLAGSLANWLKHSPHAENVRRGLAIAIGVAAVWFLFRQDT